MILVITGTHEQGFNRLVKCLDLYAENHQNEQVVIQYGYSTYIPSFADGYDLLDVDELERFANKARLIITHGGPGSISIGLSRGIIPIVIPRDPEKNEHVDNHQVLFARFLHDKQRVITCEDVELLHDTITNYNQLVDKFTEQENEAVLNRVKLKRILNNILN